MFDTKYCKITHIRENATILCEWKQFCRGDDYRNPLIYANEPLSEFFEVKLVESLQDC